MILQPLVENAIIHGLDGCDNGYICIYAAQKDGALSISVTDDGCGMSEEQLDQVEDPFFTTRTTRKVGLGIPFFKMAALSAGGSFRIDSKIGEGTVVLAKFQLNHIDRMPWGMSAERYIQLIHLPPGDRFRYTYRYDEKEFVLDTCQMKEILGGIPLDTPEVPNTYGNI